MANNIHHPTELRGRPLVARLARAAKGGLVSVGSAAASLGAGPRETAMKLASLARRGWLRRVRRGLYLVVPLEVEPDRGTVVEDPWVLACEAFRPCYIGGWSAAEHWGLTEQIFRSTLVVTAASVRSTSKTLLGSEFRLFKIPKARVSGITNLWRGSTQIPVSSRERTLVDGLRNPEICGGLRTLFFMLREYSNSREFNSASLLREMKSFGNGAAWKRLGYMTELVRSDDHEISDVARAHMSEGISRLEPAIKKKGRLLRRWRLWINVSLSKETDGA